jgi:hypothetical protein
VSSSGADPTGIPGWRPDGRKPPSRRRIVWLAPLALLPIIGPLAVTAWLDAGTGGADIEVGDVATPGSQAWGTAPPVADWMTFNNDAGQYSVRFPGAPITEALPVDPLPNQPSTTIPAALDYWGSNTGGLSFSVRWIVYPPETLSREDVPSTYDGVMNSVTTKNNAELVASHDITLDGHPGREFTIKDSDGLATLRECIVGDRSYLWGARDASPDDTAAFLDSFKPQ